MKKCQPGTICIENLTLAFIVICVGVVGYYYMFYKPTLYQAPVINNYQQPTIQRIYQQPVINYTQTTSYHQVGILTPLNGKETNNILPLMGRQLSTRRGLWNYYTISNQHNNVKLPISVRGKSALGERGVDEIFNGDSVFVEGVFDAYKATVYDNETIRYMP